MKEWIIINPNQRIEWIQIKKYTKVMGLIKSSQETYGRIFNHVRIGEYDWTRLDMSEDSLWSLKQNNNNKSYIYHQSLSCYTTNYLGRMT